MTENPQQHRRPGEWPATDAVDHDEHAYAADHDELYMQRAAEHALHELVLDSIRHDLTQQPSPATVRAAARAWCARITAAAEDIVRTMR